jgi:chaperone required for assembly of F1-ATPase
MKKPLRKPLAPDKLGLLEVLAPYAESDVLCYRADQPPELAARQEAEWDPLLAWARARFDVAINVTAGIIHIAQPPATIERLRAALASCSAEQLLGMHTLITINGSLITALMVAEGAITPDAAFDVCHLDELWQVQLWGEDWLATEARELRKADYVAAAAIVLSASA